MMRIRVMSGASGASGWGGGKLKFCRDGSGEHLGVSLDCPRPIAATQWTTKSRGITMIECRRSTHCRRLLLHLNFPEADIRGLPPLNAIALVSLYPTLYQTLAASEHRLPLSLSICTGLSFGADAQSRCTAQSKAQNRIEVGQDNKLSLTHVAHQPDEDSGPHLQGISQQADVQNPF